VAFLKRLMPQYPLPVIIVSALSRAGAAVTLDALASGAVDFVLKPSSSFGRRLDTMAHELTEKVLIAAATDVSHWRNRTFRLPTARVAQQALQESSSKVIAIGASTGGTVALTRIVAGLPRTIPGCVIVQHMPPVFTAMFADKLNQISAVEVAEAVDGERVLTGRVLVAPGGMHTTLERQGGRYVVRCLEGEAVNGHCPSVDVMMHSVARSVGANAVGVVLTGMGADGADGLLAMRKAGARTFAQDEASSVVFGMPKQAHAIGGAERLIPIDDVTAQLVALSREIVS
ncbi:MAG: chemotaxis-specific protein-glutamate methyltransferase CheB, partial [Spirochaetota bacterium]